MRRSVFGAFALTFVLFVGCYHATIETGRRPSGETISKPWATSFVYGLVPPGTVETAAKCPDGVSKVETQQSFLNGLVGILTLGIFTPMTIEVACASAGTADVSSPMDAATLGKAEKILQEAIDLSRDTGKPVYVKL